MKINRVKLRNYKKFDEAEFQFHPDFTVLIGDNATGKTSILNALATLLSTYLLRADVFAGRWSVKKDEARLLITEKNGLLNFEPQKEVFLEAEGFRGGRSFFWKRRIKDRGGDATELIEMSSEDFMRVSKGDDVDLPVLLYYGSSQLRDIHSTVKTGKPGSRLTGYRNCLDCKSDNALFESWFKTLELTVLQKNKSIPALDVVRNTVMACIPNAKRFFFDVEHDQLMIEFKDLGHCPFNNLSDGYRIMVAMVADIAHRASRLNPHFGADAAQKASGVVLIDEIDLHLHPKWQRRVVGDLKKVFPGIQFIATTHSPFIIQSMDSGEIIDLNQPTSANIPSDGRVVALPAPVFSYSHHPIEDIVEDVMGIELPQRSRRYQEMYAPAKEYYALLEDGVVADAEKKEAIKQKLDELSAPFSEYVAYHAFLEMKREAAGLGVSEKGQEN
jgi:predicted ATP-binding protein involved in virulence